MDYQTHRSRVGTFQPDGRRKNKYKIVLKTKKVSIVKTVMLLTLLINNRNMPDEWKEKMQYTKNHKKCQPAAGDMPDLIQTVHVPSSWLARPIKINGTEKSGKSRNSGKWKEN